MRMTGVTRQRRRAESSALPKHCDTDTPSRSETKRRNRAQRRVGRLEAAEQAAHCMCHGDPARVPLCAWHGGGMFDDL